MAFHFPHGGYFSFADISQRLSWNQTSRNRKYYARPQTLHNWPLLSTELLLTIRKKPAWGPCRLQQTLSPFSTNWETLSTKRRLAQNRRMQQGEACHPGNRGCFQSCFLMFFICMPHCQLWLSQTSFHTYLECARPRPPPRQAWMPLVAGGLKCGWLIERYDIISFCPLHIPN